MFESADRLASEIRRLLDVVREIAGGRYACLLDHRQVLFECGAGPGTEPLRRFLKERAGALFGIPDAMEGDVPKEDVFDAWEDDAFFLAFINGRVVLVIACPQAEGLAERAMKPLRALTDRLLRWNASFRLDRKGRGLFLGRPRLDMVVIGRPGS